jgi:hypothetical protein
MINPRQPVAAEGRRARFPGDCQKCGLGSLSQAGPSPSRGSTIGGVSSVVLFQVGLVEDAWRRGILPSELI